MTRPKRKAKVTARCNLRISPLLDSQLRNFSANNDQSMREIVESALELYFHALAFSYSQTISNPLYINVSGEGIPKP